ARNKQHVAGMVLSDPLFSIFALVPVQGETMQTQETAKILPIEFRETGSGPVVILVHGWMVSGRIWNRLLPLLQGFRVIMPDVRGSGASAALASGSVTLADHVTDLVALVEALDVHDAHLVGHSMGGQLAALL